MTTSRQAGVSAAVHTLVEVRGNVESAASWKPRRWLEAWLENVGRVDLMGHDERGAHGVTLAVSRPDLTRIRVSDTARP